MKQNELNKKLKSHKRWLEKKKGGESLFLKNENLSLLNFMNWDLRHAKILNCDLRKSALENVNLQNSLLQECNLEGSNLKNANLIGCYLAASNFSCTNLERGNLEDSNLSFANFENANLSHVNFKNVNLLECIGNNKELKTIQTGKYYVVYTKDVMRIGFKQYPIKQWFSCSNDFEIQRMHDGKEGLIWWKQWKPILKKIFRNEGLI